jgi:dual specificity phosphatase 12
MSGYITNYNNNISVDQIIPRLWLGNYQAALDIDFLSKNKINLVINCTPNIPFVSNSNIRGIETFRIPVYDSLLEKDIILMEQYFKIIIPLLLRKYTIEKKNILIHCHAGKQRSAIVTAALLKVLVDNNYINITDIPKQSNKIKQFNYIYNYMLSKRPKVFSYGFRVNFEKTYFRYFNISFSN